MKIHLDGSDNSFSLFVGAIILAFTVGFIIGAVSWFLIEKV
ncbi:hypothetical protein [Flavobacterium anhuiense]|nr:hypothetical protein [Flavobacterium anhuiense]